MKKLLETKAMEFKISLRGTKPLVWRSFSVTSDISFYEFHDILQMVMGWENSHLFAFMVDEYRIEDIDESFDAMGLDKSKVIDADDITLGEALFNTDIKKFTYEYDFGDGWLHDLEINKIQRLDDIIEYPLCVDGKMNCPPEDCGGIPGFYHLLKIIGDKNHPEHKEMREWAGEYDPEHFSTDEVNLRFIVYENGYDEELGFPDDDDYGEFDEHIAPHLDEIFGDLLGPIEVKVVNKSKHPLPSYESEGSAGMDLRANLEKPISLKPLERAIVKTGLFIALPLDIEAQVRPRSGLAAKHGISVLNAPGTIDADYRGEIGVILVNLSNEEFTIEDGDRIAQLVIARHERAEWVKVKKLGETKRGEGGFGSTGFQ